MLIDFSISQDNFSKRTYLGALLLRYSKNRIGMYKRKGIRTSFSFLFDINI